MDTIYMYTHVLEFINLSTTYKYRKGASIQ